MDGSPIGLLLALTYGTPAPAVVGPGIILDGGTPDSITLNYNNEATLAGTRTGVILENEIT